MKKTFLQMAGLLTLSGLFAGNPATKTVANYHVIPLPNEISVQQADPFVLNEKTIIVYPDNNVALKKNAKLMSQYMKDITGKSLKTSKKANEASSIVLATGLKNENPEAYRIEVTKTKITITGTTEKGVFYGMQTLRKSIQPAATIEFPAVTINDAPRFSYRGMMLDVSRHFFTVKEVKEYIDMLALHNVNTLHWHLTDDQGWRIEIKKYPLLTKIGSERAQTVIGHNSPKYDGKPYGGFYTQKQAREIVAYAADRFINVIPEIDMPGHMQGALAAYPELGCTGGPYKVRELWGISDDVLCVGNDKTLDFIKNVLSELVEIFPSKYVHIGGDECPKTSWKKCPKCQARIQALGLSGDGKHSAEERFQSYFINYAEKVLNSKGRSIIGWDEILEGGLAPNATVMSWRGVSGGIEAAKQNHDVVMTPNSYVYFDYYQSRDTKSEPDAIGGFLPVERVYSYEPIPSTLTPEEQKHIIGVQANVWTEYIPTFSQVEYMSLPRMAALAEVQWSKPEQKNYSDFLARLPQLVDMYKLYGYNYAKHVFNK